MLLVRERVSAVSERARGLVLLVLLVREIEG